MKREKLTLEVNCPNEVVLEQIYSIVDERADVSFHENVVTVTENSHPGSGQVIQHLGARISTNRLFI